ncbi:MAG TPA: HpnA protein, partial [Planctomycetaceae bacterium]|nr:HpnA protein [Planctomycetaceae bacterium]
MKVFLTGGTGLLGNNLARQLSDRGDQVVALVRQQPSDEIFAGVDVEFVRGDLTASDTIDQAVARCDAVIHSAALIHIGWQLLDESMRANRNGTEMVAQAARKHGKRMVHVGTVNTLAMPPQRMFGSSASGSFAVADERTPKTAETEQVPCSYVLSKIASVDMVQQQVALGLDACIVHPGFMLGPWDWKPSSGRMMLELGRRPFVPACPTGGCSVCDVRDVAAGTLAALDRGQTGRQYILAGENWTYRRLWKEMAARMGRPAPVLPIGPLIRVAAVAYGTVARCATGTETDVNSAALKMASQML